MYMFHAKANEREFYIFFFVSFSSFFSIMTIGLHWSMFVVLDASAAAAAAVVFSPAPTNDVQTMIRCWRNATFDQEEKERKKERKKKFNFLYYMDSSDDGSND
jgi:hypothetical protein